MRRARLGLRNGLVYALDREVHAYLTEQRVPSFDGSANLDAWNLTRLQRHIQAAEAERHLAAAAIAASGLNVLLTEASHVMLRDATPMLYAAAKANVDAAFGRSACNGKPPIGCGFWWNLAFLIGQSEPQRGRSVAWQLGGIRTGSVDFYLRWWNGAHCIFSGYGKQLGRCAPALDPAVAPADVANTTTTVAVTLTNCREVEGARLGMLPAELYAQENGFYGPSGVRHATMIARAAKPTQRDRLRLDRYDEQDFTELVAAMKADGLWVL